jgi:hypothetical protein
MCSPVRGSNIADVALCAFKFTSPDGVANGYGAVTNNEALLWRKRSRPEAYQGRQLQKQSQEVASEMVRAQETH